ncbi:hypothetical protein ACFLU0_00250 [Chloroflexota bacterium]
MRFLKGLAIGLLSFLLFWSLSVSGIAFLINQTILNSNFIISQLDKLDVAVLAEEVISDQENGGVESDELSTALVDTVAELEPVIKEGIGDTIEPVYDYLKGKSESIDLAQTIRDNLLSSEVITSLVNSLDIASMATEIISEQIPEDIPEDLEFLVEDVDDIITELEPTIKEELITAADPILDYLLGESQSAGIEISLEPIVEELEDTLKETLLESPPAELAGLSLFQLEQYFDMHFGEMTEMIPPTIELDEATFSGELPAQIAEALEMAEERLEEAKEYIGYFQLGYKLLIGFIVLLILGIILLNRQVRSATRKLSIIFLTHGILWFAGILVAKYFIKKAQLPWTEIPPSLETQLPRLVNDFSAPLQWFSLGLLIGGVVLLIVSFVYKSRQQRDEL